MSHFFNILVFLYGLFNFRCNCIRKLSLGNRISSKSTLYQYLNEITYEDSEFMTWAKSNLIQFDSISLKYQNNIRGLYSEKDCVPDEVLIKVPFSLCFSGRNDKVLAYDTNDSEWPMEVAIELLTEYDKRNQIEYHKKPYFDILPDWKSLNLPIRLNTQNMSKSCLQFTDHLFPDLLNLIESQREWRDVAFSKIKLNDSNIITPQQHESISYFLDIVQTRNCRLYQNNGEIINVVVPMIDLLNHKHIEESNAAYFEIYKDDNENEIEYVAIVCTKPIKKGEEICISYGDLDAQETLVSYGFIPTSSPYDKAKFLLPFQYTDPGVHVVNQELDSPLLLLSKLKIFPDDPGYVLYRDGVGSELFLTSRLLTMTIEELKKLNEEIDNLQSDQDINTLSIFSSCTLNQELKALQLIKLHVDDLKIKLDSFDRKLVTNDNIDSMSGDEEILWKYLASLREWKLSIINDNITWLTNYMNDRQSQITS